METVVLEAALREETGTNAVRRLRREGRVPGILYGLGRDNVRLTLKDVSIKSLLHSMARMVNLKWDDKTEAALIKDIQYDTFGKEVLHVDFVRVDLHTRVVIHVPIELYGHPIGVKEGGVLDHQLKEAEIECMPTAIPEKIRVNVSELGVGHSILAKDIVVPAEATMKSPPDTVVASIRMVEEEKVVSEEETLAEPEVITRKAEKEEGEEEK